MPGNDVNNEVAEYLDKGREELRKTSEMEAHLQHVIIRERSDSIDKNTKFTGNNELGLTAYVRVDGEGEFHKSDKSVIKATDYAEKKLLGTKLPESMDVVWVRNGPINEVVLPRIKLDMQTRDPCYADMRVAFNINIGSDPKDITDFIGQYELQMESTSRIGGGDVSILSNKDIMQRFEHYSRESFQQAAINVNSIRETCDDIRPIIIKNLGEEPMVTRQMIDPEYVSISFDKTYTELLQEQWGIDNAKLKDMMAKGQNMINGMRVDFELRTQMLKMELKMQDEINNLTRSSRTVEME